MKKLLFVINNMNIGGIQKALIQLLNSICYNYEITLFCIQPNGQLMESVPKSVKCIDSGKTLQISEMSLSEAKKRGLSFYAIRFLCSAWTKLFGKKFPAKIITKYVQPFLGDYDVAISYTQPITYKDFNNLSNEVVLNSCSASQKITFVHCDFLAYGGNDEYNRNLYRSFDKIAVVSDSVGRKIVAAIPDVENKVQTVYNCCNINYIKQLAKINPVSYSENIPVITVARLSKEKGLERCISQFVRLRKEGYDVAWHIIGGGIEESKLREKIHDLQADEFVFLHGSQENPYRFMKNAKLFLLSSYHEAAPVVFQEAMALNLPILTTKTTSAIEMVENTGAGWVCDLWDDAIYDMLRKYCDGSMSSLCKDPKIKVSPIEQFKIVINDK